MIREGKIKDIEVITNNNIQLAKETENLDLDYQTVKRGVENLILSPEKGKYFVYEYQDKVVGQLMITYEWSDWRNSFFIWIQSVYIDKDYRNKGIFKELYNYVKKIAHKEKSAAIRLYVEKMNMNAKEVYEKLGMQESYYLLYEEKIEGE